MNVHDKVIEKNESPRSESTQSFTGAERKSIPSKPICNDLLELNPKGISKTEIFGRTRQGSSWLKSYTLGTWNERTMSCGKLDIVKSEMERNKVNLLEISELKWIGRGHFCSENCNVYFSENETKRQYGVAIILDKSMQKAILGYNPISSRFITKDCKVTL